MKIFGCNVVILTVVVVFTSSFCTAQFPNQPPEAMAKLIRQVGEVSPNGVVAVTSLREIAAQQLRQTGDAAVNTFLNETARRAALRALLDLSVIEVGVDLARAKSPAGREVVNLWGGSDAVRAFDSLTIATYTAKDHLTQTVQQTILFPVKGSTQANPSPAWIPSNPPVFEARAGGRNADVMQKVKSFSPYCYQDLLIAREIAELPSVRSGNDKLDAAIADARTKALLAVQGLAGTEIFVDVVDAKVNNLKGAKEMLRAFVGPKQSPAALALFDSSEFFDEENMNNGAAQYSRQELIKIIAGAVAGLTGSGQ